jgi:hypothetical protein
MFSLHISTSGIATALPLVKVQKYGNTTPAGSVVTVAVVRSQVGQPAFFK